MNFYDSEKKEFVEINDNFIYQYANAYFYSVNQPQPKPFIKGLHRSSYYPEKEIERILKDGIKTPEDVVHILAWKIGKIKHLKCTNESAFKYSDDWKNLKYDNKGKLNNNTVKLRSTTLEIKAISEYVSDADNLAKWKEMVNSGNWFEVLKDLQEKKWSGLGTVYCITLLYFISGGEYPIFDQFVDKALDAICEQKCKFPNANKNYIPLQSELPKKDSYLEKFKIRYTNYCENINKIKCQLSEEYRDPKNRDLDRALWVYGHLKCADCFNKQ